MKNKQTILDDSGFALLTTLVISFLTLGLIAVAYFISTSGTELSGVGKRYTVELDVAKGTAGYIMAEIRNSNLSCNQAAPGDCIGDSTPDSCSANAQIIINPQVCTALGRTGQCTGLSACFMSKNELDDPPDYTTFYSVRVNSLGTNGEQATIDFVYRTVESP